MSIEKIMSIQLVTVEMDDDLSVAKDLFDQHNIHHLLVLDGKQLAGIITDRDLFKHLSPTVGTNKESFADKSLLQKKVHLIMSRDLVTATPEHGLNEAVLLFYDNHISCLPVVNGAFEAIGIITWRDIFKVLALQYRQKQAQLS